MSQKATRKTVAPEEKEKRQTDSPVKDMKKKMAANAEKEKQAAEKTDKVEKSTEKNEKPVDKSAEKNSTAEKKDKTEKKETEKKAEPVADKAKDDKAEKNGKEREDKKKQDKPKQNGKHNGVNEVTANGDDSTGTVSGESEDDGILVIDDHDEMFPELTYDDTSDAECFESPTPENLPSRSLTRRSQVKATRTPETPRPASDKQSDKDTNSDDSKESKILKLKDDAAPSTDRKLRSSDSPKPESKKPEKAPEPQKKVEKESPKKAEKVAESPKKAEKVAESPKKAESKKGDEKDKESKPEDKAEKKENGEKAEKMDVEVTVEVEGGDEESEPRKTDTNFSKSRVKVSPYRRSMRLADQTTSSVMANYTGNNTTMEMDITETSSFISEEPSLDDSSYLSGLRSIRGRRSYKPLKEMALRHVAVNRSTRSTTTTTTTSTSATEQPSRPTAPVVGRKRKPEAEDIELATEASESLTHTHQADAHIHAHTHAQSKRMRLLDRIAVPFRRATLPPSRAAEIVGINTDLPLTAPVASPDTFDPESLKPATLPTIPTLPTMPTPANIATDKEPNKKCVIM